MSCEYLKTIRKWQECVDGFSWWRECVPRSAGPMVSGSHGDWRLVASVQACRSCARAQQMSARNVRYVISSRGAGAAWTRGGCRRASATGQRLRRPHSLPVAPRLPQPPAVADSPPRATPRHPRPTCTRYSPYIISIFQPFFTNKNMNSPIISILL